jgi:SAM-dependent methyltransferase
MTGEADQLRAHYDAIPYLSAAFAQTHPDNLRTIAALAGVDAPDVTHSRVLEIGCATGRNLMPMAQTLPNSTFVGIDLSPRQIEAGNARVRELGLTNITLRALDLLDFTRDEGEFDYIIAHGFYSWVPANVRDRLMQICAQHLSPQGVANISYNTLPGWHLKRPVRDMMLFNGAGDATAPPPQRIAKAREMTAFANQPSPGWRAYKEILAEEQKALGAHSDWYILHDYVEPENYPVYFEQFIEQATAHGLSYLGDAAPGVDAFDLVPPAALEQARRFSEGDVIRLHQYLDYLQGRQYRASIICRGDAPRRPAPAASLDLISSLYIAGRLLEEPGGTDPASGKALTHFTSLLKTPKLTFNDDRLTAIFRRIKATWPHALSFGQLIQGIDTTAPGAGGEPFVETLARALLTGYRSSIVELWSRPTDFLPTRFDRPRATPLARLQAANDEPLVNLRHQHIPSNAATKGMLPLCDGTRNRNALLRDMTRMIQRGGLKLPTHGGGFVTPQHDLGAVIDQMLSEFFANSLFIAH